jgi:8-oxo-dGTP pyrophosphatase MutT (NUDIX family)
MTTHPSVPLDGVSDFTVAPALADYNIQIDDLLVRYKTDATHLAVGVLVFDSAGKVLLIQRSASDSMSHKWEIPGGGCDPEDPSALHSAARELLEETGLHAKRMIRVVGNGHRFQSTRGLKILKLTFEVAIDDDTEGQGAPGALAVRLDPKEHQSWLWASEEEVAMEKAGSTKLAFTKDEQKAVILEGFSKRATNKTKP